MSRQWIFGGLTIAVIGSLFINRSYASPQGDGLSLGNLPKAEKGTAEQITMHQSQTTSEILGGKDRYLTDVSTDKPMYRAGENVYVRGVLLSANGHKPISDTQGVNATIEVTGPKGDVVARGTASAQDSSWGFSWTVPEGQAGGQYLLKVTYPWNGHAPAERKFDIRAYRAPRLKSQITFLRDGYGPGEKVSATLDVKRAEGGVPTGAKVSVTAVVDGVAISGATAKVDSNGLCSVSLDLPHDIPRGEGTLALIIEDGGVVETASKTIPILLQTVDLKMYPEGGDLIAGYPNRLYIQATLPNGKPADLAGKLIAKGSNGSLTDVTVAEFATEHEGRGRIQFTPDANKDYFLTINEPAGIKTTYPLPQAKAAGALIRAEQDTFAKGQPVTVLVGASNQKFSVTLAKRETVISECHVDLSKRSDVKAGTLLPITFVVPDDAEGVLTATIWSDKDVPLAERLIFRAPQHPLKVSITQDKKNYVPGDKAKLTVKATDENDKPVAAVVGVTVTDDSVLEMIEKREQAPRLPVMAFLEPEVSDLADAHVYLDEKNSKAALATDLLLGTQGWRRFALMDLAKFIEKNGDKARRVVALKIQAQHEVRKAMKEGGQMRFRGGGMAFGAPGMAMEMANMAMPMAAPAAPAPAGMGGAPQEVPMEDEAKDQAPQASDKKMPARQEIAAASARPMPELQAAQNKIQMALGKADAMERKARLIDGDAMLDNELAFSRSAQNDLVMVREFAYEVRKDRNPTDRVDFTETLFWNSGVKTDAKTGEATVSFGLNDSVSTFRVFADAFNSDGALGATNIGVESVQPFYAELKMPLEVTAGDHILLPVSMVNATSSELVSPDISINLNGESKESSKAQFKLLPLVKNGSALGAGGRVRYIQPIDVDALQLGATKSGEATVGVGTFPLILSAKSGLFQDKVTRTLSVKAKGFPIEKCFGGMLEPGKTVVHTITIPKEVINGSIASNTAVYPTPLANMTEALERLIQDPCGCFEQTCSTSYPLTMAQQYFLSHTGVDPKLVESSRKKLDTGYKMLVGFWCPDKGYEWFGENPGHEALTAFGLMHFSDMAQVREVDKTMVANTRAWLFKQKDGKGGFSRKRRALHTWIEDKDCSNAYILWSLLETGQPASDLKPEIDSLKSAAASSQNSYVLALAANALYLSDNKAEAKKLMDKLAAKQKADGSIGDTKSSIVGSEGEALAVEGAALTTLAWMREPQYAGNVEKSVKFLADSCKAGRYGSTQSTVLALRAIVTYDKLRAKPKAPGKVRLYVDGQSIGDWADFTPATTGAIKLPDLSELLTPGEHKLELRMEGGAPMPYSMAVNYNAIKPASSEQCKLDLKVSLAQTNLTEGNATEASVTVTNKEKAVVPTPVAIIGLPGGLEPRHDQLKELVKKGKIDAYEVRGREVVLYWRTLDAEAKVEIPLSLIAAVPGSYTGPASRAYLYYTDENKQWVDGVAVEIAAK
ncbi:MAG: MG2 domain-containing protein [Candidatus Melainabacteria bacterium]|nr:MG2 domain-containing protein [Candidatus Melainabacteria bacterium]